MRDKSQEYIGTSGGLLSLQFVSNLRQKNIKEKYVKADTFTMPGENPLTPHELEKKITNAWEILLEKWFAVSVSIKNYDVSTARKKWIIPLLEALDYNPKYLKKDTEVSEEKKVKISLSHRGGDWDHAPIIHIVAPDQSLDEKSANRRGVKSPHDSLQLYLNESKKDLWGVVTNGIVLRILRDYYHTYTKGYVEFDLEALFEMRSFSDFLALYRLVHPSRFVPDEEGISPLEHFYKTSLAAGEKIGDELRENVKKAIEVLGNGFLTKDLVDTMIKNPEKCKEYYREILHVIYRIIFLMFAEQRGMLPTRDSLYAETYSMTKLREKAAKIKRRDRHCDLWKGLVVTFEIIKKGVKDPESKLTAFGYNGSLFDETEIKQLKDLDCKNTNMLEAIRYLTYFESEKTLQRISYVDLGVEEIGSIYESLLDYTPRILGEDIAIDGVLYPAKTFFLDPRGAARKSTGSYYTHPGLINELIHSALKPVLEDRLSGKESIEDKEKALLSIKVCDPACGSGAFLIAATNFLGKELAKIRTDTEYPSDKEERKARRDVLQHCIYGVDLNSMAVELAKVSLWINDCVRDMPLNFLNHHIKWGNSLIGATPELIEKGIPDEAFTPVTGDDRKFAKKVVKINKNQRKARTMEEEAKIERKERKYVLEYKELSDIKEERPEDVDRKKEKYDSIVHSPELHHRETIANAWTAAFFWPLHSNGPRPPTEGVLRVIKKDEKVEAVDKQTLKKIDELADEYTFFHWYLEFPDIFSGDDPGFDCVIGNPPWEKIKLQENEFFLDIDPDIANARTAAVRRKMIRDLKTKNPTLYEIYRKELAKRESMSSFSRNSDRFLLSAHGDINTFALFTELGSTIISDYGRTGLIVPSGIATDHTTRTFFQHLVNNAMLTSLYDIENRERIYFPEVYYRMRFCLLTMNGTKAKTGSSDLVFYITNVDQLKEPERHFSLSKKDFEMINPNTLTCPTFKGKTDAEIIKKIYRNSSVLIHEEKENPWGITFLRMFDMTNDSNLFETSDGLEARGYVRDSFNNYCLDDKKYLRLYEGRMIDIYNHRLGSAVEKEIVLKRSGDSELTTESQYKDIHFAASPRFWVDESEVKKEYQMTGIKNGSLDLWELRALQMKEHLYSV
jgi:type I restriction-modification system DNA methylase subunit